jgi:hypothetical protein
LPVDEFPARRFTIRGDDAGSDVTVIAKCVVLAAEFAQAGGVYFLDSVTSALLGFQKTLSVSKTVPSPGGQASGITSHHNCCGWARWAEGGISSRATTRQPGS